MTSSLRTGQTTGAGGAGAVHDTAPRLYQLPDGRHKARTEPHHWVDDLTWHQNARQYSKFRWTPQDARALAGDYTHGRLEFLTIGDLHRLARCRRRLGEQTSQVMLAFGYSIREARVGLQIEGWESIAELLWMNPIECGHAAFFSRWDADVRPDTHPDVARIHTMTSKLLFNSPLITAWELKQMLRMYQGAESIVDDTLADLVLELKEDVREAELMLALDYRTPEGLWDFVETQRRERGEPGDKRRIPEQTFR